MKVDKQKFDALLDRMIQMPPMKRDDLRTNPPKKRGTRPVRTALRSGR